MSEDKRTFDDVLEDELKIVLESRHKRLGPAPAPLKGDTATEKAHDAQLVGLAFWWERHRSPAGHCNVQ